MNNVVICGKFDPVHDGHIDHIIKASKLGDYLIIITHTDDVVANSSKKGVCAVPLWARKLILEGLLLVLKINGEVVVAEPLDNDGTIKNNIVKLKPYILAKGGDRILSNMPISELLACKEIGCEVVYGVGDLLNSSSKIMQGEVNE
jgi:cytidyltransferase-like protein